MAQKRMFDRGIIRTDNFIDMPPTSQNLYFHLGMEADDEGFVSPKMVMRMIGSGDDDLKVLIMKGFVLPFQSGVIVITDWNENNYLDKNRLKETKHQEEKKQLCLTNNNKYVFNTCLTSIEEKRREEDKGSGENSFSFKGEIKNGKPRRLPPDKKINDRCVVDGQGFIKRLDHNTSKVSKIYGKNT